MRVVYLNASGQLGGAETSLLEMLRAIRTAQPDWELCVITGSEGPLITKLTALGIRVTVFPFPRALSQAGEGNCSFLSLTAASVQARSYIMRLKSYISSYSPDLIHAAGFKMQVLACWAKPKYVPLIWHIHDYVGSRRIMRRMLSVHSHQCSHAIVNSYSVAADLQRVCSGLRSTVIYNAVDQTRFHPAGPIADLDTLSGLPPAEAGTCKIGLLATFAHWKGHKIFLNALASICREKPARGYIIGAPIYQTVGSQCTVDELKQEAERLGLGERIGFTGFIEDSAAALRALDVVVHASTEPEPFGMVIIEAMACGKPVVIASCGGAAELFEEGKTGLGHSPGRIDELAGRLRQLIADADLRSHLAGNGRRNVEKRFSPESLVEKLLPVYSRVAKTPLSLRDSISQNN